MQSLEVPEGHYLHVVHLHPGNDPDGDKRRKVAGLKFPRKDPPEYVTIAFLKKKEDKQEVSRGIAVCHNGLDVPSRKRGHFIATRRALKGATS